MWGFLLEYTHFRTKDERETLTYFEMKEIIQVGFGQAGCQITDSIVKTFSAEHGIGSLKKEQLISLKDPNQLNIMRQIKKIFLNERVRKTAALFKTTLSLPMSGE